MFENRKMVDTISKLTTKTSTTTTQQKIYISFKIKIMQKKRKKNLIKKQVLHQNFYHITFERLLKKSNQMFYTLVYCRQNQCL